MQTHVPASTEQAKQQTKVAQQPAQLVGEQAVFEDNRPEAAAQLRLQTLANNSPQAAQLKSMQSLMSASPQVQQMKAMQSRMAASAQMSQPIINIASAPIQRQDDENSLQGTSEVEPVQREASDSTPPESSKPNNTGLPDNLKTGIESLSGVAMDDVKVHYNSLQPAQLQAHAFAQGTDIHVAPGQEQHLPHEAWHVVQQKQGRVRPTFQMKGHVQINDDAGLEREADVMGGRALYASVNNPMLRNISVQAKSTGLMPSTIQKATDIKHAAADIKDPEGGENIRVGVRMRAKLDPDDEVKGSATNADSSASYTGIKAKFPPRTVVAGHLLNHDLGGMARPENLYPITQGANARHSDEVEQIVKNEFFNFRKRSEDDHFIYNVDVVNYENVNQEIKFVCQWGSQGGEMKRGVISSDIYKEKDPWFPGHHNGRKRPGWDHGKRKGAKPEEYKDKVTEVDIRSIVPIDVGEYKTSGRGPVKDWTYEVFWDPLFNQVNETVSGDDFDEFRDDEKLQEYCHKVMSMLQDKKEELKNEPDKITKGVRPILNQALENIIKLYQEWSGKDEAEDDEAVNVDEGEDNGV